ncbi:phosphomannomutase [bacterium]|nr:phosphomannomutase [bacterium]
MLKFGTSGLRGLLTDMTDKECYINTRGFINYLLQSSRIQASATVSLAGDLRFSTDRIMEAVGKAVLDAGCQVENCGKIPSPAVMYHAIQNKQASIMVTGSHIPDDRNGIKFNKADGEVLKSDEPGILAQVAKAREEDFDSLFADNDMFRSEVDRTLLPMNAQAEQGYVDRYLEIWPTKALSGKKIVVDQHSAVGRDLLVKILGALGADVVPIGRSEKFIPKDTENITEETKANFIALARKHQPFAIVSTDGDSDRPFVVGEKGEFYRGDILGAVVARFIHARFAAVPISANDAIDAYLQEAEIERVQTRIGSPYVIAAMQEGNKDNKLPVVGWEVNGGFMLGSDMQIQGRVLKALPTRDAVFPILCALLAAAQAGSVSKLFQELSHRFTQAGLIDDFPVEISQKLVQTLKPEAEGVIEIDFKHKRPSVIYQDGRIEALEAAPRQPDTIDPKAFWQNPLPAHREYQIKQVLENNYFTTQLGFSDICKINVVDGIRISFSNGDVAHIRPSGNAPQLRIYSNANSQARADEIVEQGLADTGILRQMEHDIS